jgi:3-phosphoshikimate 1-carboxyvinyltransferase
VRVTVHPGGRIRGIARVPGDKSIAHRVLILAATANGRSHIRGLPSNLDVRATARVLADVTPSARADLHRWVAVPEVEGDADPTSGAALVPELQVQGEGRGSLTAPADTLDCANSGTTLRLMAGVLAGVRFRSRLTGDESLLRRPMERVARPLRAMGADVSTTGGRPPVEIAGGSLRAIDWSPEVPSAQVKGAVLLAALVADGETTVRERAPTRDHTECLLEALGAPVRRGGNSVSIRRFQHDRFEAVIPGDLSSAVFLVAAAAVTDGSLAVVGVGLNPTRTAVLDVFGRMGVTASTEATGASLGEPSGSVETRGGDLAGIVVDANALPLVVDEVPALAAVAAHGRGESRFDGAGELRVKESDRLAGLAAGLRELGGEARVEGDGLVVAGGGLAGGRTDARGDHRLAMAFTIAALGATGPSEIDGVESAGVSFPGFLRTLAGLGAPLEVRP